jgi:hypothetical protein
MVGSRVGLLGNKFELDAPVIHIINDQDIPKPCTYLLPEDQTLKSMQWSKPQAQALPSALADGFQVALSYDTLCRQPSATNVWDAHTSTQRFPKRQS